MKKSLFISIVILFFSSTAYTQTNLVKFKAGAEIETPRTNEIGYAGNADVGIVVLTERRGKLILTGFNPANLSQTNEGEEEFNKERNFNTEFVANMQGKSYWLNSDWDKDNEKEKLYAAEIDIKNCKLKQQKLILEASKMAADELGGGFAFSASKSVNKYKFHYAKDRKFLLVSYFFIPGTHRDKNNFDKIGLQLFDENMQKAWGSEFVMPYTTARVEYSDYLVDTKGNAYMLLKVYSTDKRKERVDGKPGFHYEVLTFSAAANVMKQVPVNPDGYSIFSSYIIDGGKDQVYVVSACSRSAVSEGIEGFFVSKMDGLENLVKFNNGFYELPFEELAKLDSKKSKRKKVYKGNGGFRIRSVRVEADGSFFMSGEDFGEVCATTASGYGGCNLFFDNITAIKFNPDGKAAWTREIPKQTQIFNTTSIGEYSGQLSYSPFADESGYYFLFNDHEDNFNLKADDEPKLFRDGDPGNLVVVRLDQQGNASKQLLFKKEERQKINHINFTKLTPLQFVGKCWNGSKEFIPMLIILK